jgi:hypothetical protein
MKTCTKCKQEKEEVKFGKRYDYPTKLLSWCKDCERTRKRESAQKKYASPEARAKESLRQKLWHHVLPSARLRNHSELIMIIRLEKFVAYFVITAM